MLSILMPSADTTPLIWDSIFGTFLCNTQTRWAVVRSTSTAGKLTEFLMLPFSRYSMIS